MTQLWPPVHASWVGARHAARGEGCQDASLSHSGTLADGDSYSLIVVADGHGDSRHHRSAVGSQLACVVAAELVQEAAADQGTDWQRWWGDHFASAVVARWRQRCQQDHGQRGEGDGFSPIPYGTTLGVALLSRHWWACAGIGDWSMAQITATQARVVSQEPPQPGGGEATYSLCMEEPAALIRERCQWHRHDDPDGFALVLTTDGVHKSCLSIHDYLVLCHYLAKEGLPPPQRDEAVDLQAALAQITREGVGDDVSVAVGACGALVLSGELPSTAIA